MIEFNNEMQNISEFFKPIKYYSFIYDEIVIISNNVELKTTFEYDPTIIFNDTKSFYHVENSKKQFVFTNNFYDNAEILTIFELDDDVIKIIL